MFFTLLRRRLEYRYSRELEEENREIQDNTLDNFGNLGLTLAWSIGTIDIVALLILLI